MFTTDTSDLFNLHFCDRLLVGNDGKCLQQCVRQNIFSRRFDHFDQRFVICRLRAELIRIFQHTQHNTAVFLFITLLQPGQQFFSRADIFSDDFCQLAHFHGIPYGKSTASSAAILFCSSIVSCSLSRYLNIIKGMCLIYVDFSGFIISSMTRNVTITSALECCFCKRSRKLILLWEPI